MSAIVTYADTSNMFADTSKITLDKINQGGGGVGGGVSSAAVTAAILAARQVYTGAAPPATPNNPAIAAVFYPEGAGSMLNWDVPTQAWI